MNSWIRCGLLIIHIMIAYSFSSSSYSVIPQPVHWMPQEGVFEIQAKTLIIADEKAEPLAATLNAMLSPAMGFSLKTVKHTKQQDNLIQLQLKPPLEDTLGSEGYNLTVSEKKIQLQAAQEAGLYYGLVTLKQLLPEKIYSQTKVSSITWNVPCVQIEDYPRFQWRGMHLDVGRYFLPKEFVKKYIDLIALHKMNRFHLHLTEDQGWRIEIKKYPKLTEVGAWRKETVIGLNTDEYDGIPHGGFYTQEDVREIVAYAKQRYITVVPEIEMPGHSRAALAAYPEFSCTGGPFEVGTRWGVEENVFCAGNNEILRFLKDILKEVLDLFPSEYIHIGGDECPKARWKECPKCQARIKAESLKDEHELQSWFIKQIDDYLTKKGRRLVGWDEILEGGLAPGATVMSWRGIEGGIAAANSGHDAVMTPEKYTYLNYYQADPANEPLAIGGFIPLDKVYHYEPVPEALNPEEAKHILGAQGQIWTEYISTPQLAEYMALPRMCALAEVVWTPAEKKDYDNFYRRLRLHIKRLEKLNVNFHPLDEVK